LRSSAERAPPELVGQVVQKQADRARPACPDHQPGSSQSTFRQRARHQLRQLDASVRGRHRLVRPAQSPRPWRPDARLLLPPGIPQTRGAPGLGCRCGRNPLLRAADASTVPLRQRGAVTFKPPACRTVAGVQARALPLRQQRGRDGPCCRIGRHAEARRGSPDNRLYIGTRCIGTPAEASGPQLCDAREGSAGLAAGGRHVGRTARSMAVRASHKLRSQRDWRARAHSGLDPAMRATVLPPLRTSSGIELDEDGCAGRSVIAGRPRLAKNRVVPSGMVSWEGGAETIVHAARPSITP
jgi:hypothetical protein